MVVIKFEKLTFLNDGYVLTIRNKMGLLNIFLEPQDVISTTKNYIILCDDFAKYIPDIEQIYLPNNFSSQEILETLEKLSEVN